MNKITYYYMSDKGVRSKLLTPQEYNEIIDKAYDKEKIMNYIEDTLIEEGMDEVSAAIVIGKAYRDQIIMRKVNDLMKSTDKEVHTKELMDYVKAKNRR